MDADRAALRRRLPIGGLLAVPAAFAGLFFAYPFVSILARGLTEGGSLDVPWTALAGAETRSILWFTVWQATASTALTLAAGLPLAWVVGRFSFPGRRLVRALVLVPFVLPTVVVAASFVTLLPTGAERGALPILAAHVFFNVAVVVRIVGGFWATLGRSTWEAAAVLGAGPFRRAREITLPTLMPAISAAAGLTFLFCFTSFGVVLVLGGPSRSTLETEIYLQAVRAFDLRTASALAILQLVCVGATLAVASRLEGRVPGARELTVEREALRPALGRERALVGAIVAVTVGLLAAPVTSLVLKSLDTPTGWGLGFYRALGRETPALLVTPWRTAIWSLAFAAAATAISLCVGVLASIGLARVRTSAWDAFVLLPLGASAAMLGFGFLIAFDEPPLDVRSAWWLVPVAQSLVAVPFVIRIVTPALRAIDPTLREAAAVLGASPLRSLRALELPLVARAAAGAAGFSFAIALGEFGATVFLARAERPTLPVAIFRFLGRPGAENQGVAAALAVCLALLTVGAVLAAELSTRASRSTL